MRADRLAGRERALACLVCSKRPRPALAADARPYAILVSEVMLQQTQVERVVPRYLRWLERWPTVGALAAASTADAIVEWQGLGYNRRAVNLHRAARAVAESGWPDDLTELPGVGRTRPRQSRASPSATTCFRSTRTSGASRGGPGSASTQPARRPSSTSGRPSASRGSRAARSVRSPRRAPRGAVATSRCGASLPSRGRSGSAAPVPCARSSKAATRRTTRRSRRSHATGSW